MEFTIKNEQLSRMKVYSNYIKKLEAISPLDSNHLFYIDGNKLSIHAHGNGSLGSGFIDASFDIENNEDAFFFTTNINQFIQFLEKTKSDEISVKLTEDSKLFFKGNKTKTVFSTVVLSAIEEEVEEVRNAVTNYKTSNYYNASKDIDVSKSKEAISVASSISSLLDRNKFIKIGGNNIRVADDTSIIDLQSDITDDVFLLRTVSNIINEVNSIKVYDDGSSVWIYIDIASQGIQLYFAQPQSKYSCPNDAEIAELSPKNGSVTVKIKSEDLYNALDEFKGMFDNASWQYKQIKMITNFEDNKFELHFDNMVTYIDSELPFTLVENTLSSKENFEMLIPFIQMDLLRDFVLKSEELTYNFSDNPAECITTLKGTAGFNNIVLTKMSE